MTRIEDIFFEDVFTIKTTNPYGVLTDVKKMSSVFGGKFELKKEDVESDGPFLKINSNFVITNHLSPDTVLLIIFDIDGKKNNPENIGSMTINIKAKTIREPKKKGLFTQAFVETFGTTEEQKTKNHYKKRIKEFVKDIKSRYEKYIVK